MTLHLISFRPDFGKLQDIARHERLLPQGGDLGYAVHAAFRASFGELSPKPFRLMAPAEPGGGPRGRLFAYSAHSLSDLSAHASAFADPIFLNALIVGAEDRALPATFPTGMRLGFELRVRPTRRSGASRDRSEKARERDVFPPSNPPSQTEPGDRAHVYKLWLEEQLSRSAAAILNDCDLSGFRRTRLFLRDRSNGANAVASQDGPDALMRGVLTVGDAPAFSALLARGIGRFRAFGFGMLLLRPAV